MRLRRVGPPTGADPVLVAAVARYAARLHRTIAGDPGRDHTVCSPLGAWLLVALVADSAHGATRRRLADALGLDPAEAGERARTLLRDPHPDLAVAAALWRDPTLPSAGLDDLTAVIAPPAQAGPVPTQADADRWAREHTRGLVPSFPLDLRPTRDRVPAVVLATALATTVSWDVPFELAGADEVRWPADPRFAGIPLLRSPSARVGRAGATGWLGIVAGRFAVHAARSVQGLVVVSALGARDDAPADVLDVAQRVASARARGEEVEDVTSLAELPLGDGPAWRLGEQPGTGPSERFEALLPAWEATSELDLLATPGLGLADAGRALVALLPPGEHGVVARQSATARYSRLGFEAAAVTALGVMAAGLAAPPRPVRTAHVQFTRPFGVVAAAGGDGPWCGLPVFSAWVSEGVPAA